MRSALKHHILYFFLVFLYYVVIKLLNTTCLLKFLFGVPCPACGTTRSLLALLRLDFDSYIHYNPLGILLAAAVLVIIHINRLAHRKIAMSFAVTVLVLNFVRYGISFFNIM